MSPASSSLARPRRSDHLGAFKFLSVGRSHVGCVRELNEDALLNRPDIGLWAVADGMGGHASGDLASRMVIESLASVCSFSSAYAFRDAAAHAVQVANEALVSGVGDAMTGSTVVTLLVHHGHYACLWAGDSRAYLYRSGALRRLTRDHSLVQEMVDAGALSPEQARAHPKSNVITRAVGASGTLELDSVFGTIQPGDRFLLCSDGLSSVVSDRAIADAMRRAPLESAADGLIDRALRQGGPDNVTVVMISIEAA